MMFVSKRGKQKAGRILLILTLLILVDVVWTVKPQKQVQALIAPKKCTQRENKSQHQRMFMG